MHWFLDPIQQHYVDFEGRTSRKAFWMYILFYVIASLIVGLVAEMIDIIALTSIFWLALLLPTVGIVARRLHDTGLSGWWQLFGIIPLLGVIVVIILTVRKGETDNNKYGPVPVTKDSPVS